MKGLEEIFRERYVAQSGRLFGVAKAITGNAADAADVVQEAMVKIWRSGADMLRVANAEAYALSVVRSTAIDMLRSRRTTVDIDAIGSIAARDDADAFDTEATLLRLMATLPEHQQTVMRLSAFGGCANDEISSLTGLSPTNVRQLLCRARRKLKELYTKISQT